MFSQLLQTIIGLSLATTGFIYHQVAEIKPVLNYNHSINLASVSASNVDQSLNQSDPKVTIDFVGDIMMDRGVRNSVERYGAGDYHFLFQNVGFLKEADIAFANLEGSVSDRGTDVGSIYSFRMDPTSMWALRDAGFDLVSVANNHAGDWSLTGFEDTLSFLRQNDILAVGGGDNYDQASEVKILERNGLKIGFVGFTDVGPDWLEAKDDTPGILLASDPNLPNIISNAAKQVDILVVSYHFGVEYQDHSDVRQEELAHIAIDNGAKLVIGTHPHVVEETEKYKDGFIIYSLGNFIFDQYFSPETSVGGLLKVVADKNGIVSTDLEKVNLNYQFVPELSQN